MSLLGVPLWQVFLLALAVQYVRYLVTVGAFHYLFWGALRGFAQRRRVSNGRATNKDILREVWASFWFVATISLPVAFLVMPEHRKYTSLYFHAADYPIAWIPITFVLLMLGQDAYFYWTHRLIHSRWLFSRVHSVHHRSLYPSAFAAFAMHPLEAVIAMGFNLGFVLFVPTYFWIFIAYQVVAFALNVSGHIGLDLFPAFFRRVPVLRWLNRPHAHAAHHRYFHVNYGLYFTFWDRWMGTFDARPRPIDEPGRSTAEADVIELAGK